MIARLICKVIGHSFEGASSCPFTGKTYEYCKKCKGLREKK
jgi:hypothetical protein